MKRVGAYSSSVAATYDADREIEPLWDVEHDFVRGLIAHTRADEVLDAPVGTGRFLGLYEDMTVTGIDLSAAMLEQAERRVSRLGLSNVSLREGNVFDLPFDDGRFGLVVSWRLFHLLTPNEIAVAIGELARVCRGTLCIQTYEAATLRERLIARRKRWMRRLALGFTGRHRLTPWSHIRSYLHTREDIEQAACAAGIGVPTRRTHLGNYEGARVMALVWILR